MCSTNTSGTFSAARHCNVRSINCFSFLCVFTKWLICFDSTDEVCINYMKVRSIKGKFKWKAFQTRDVIYF